MKSFIAILLGLTTLFITCELEQELLNDEAISESKLDPSLEKNANKKAMSYLK